MIESAACQPSCPLVYVLLFGSEGYFVRLGQPTCKRYGRCDGSKIAFKNLQPLPYYGNLAGNTGGRGLRLSLRGAVFWSCRC